MAVTMTGKRPRTPSSGQITRGSSAGAPPRIVALWAGDGSMSPMSQTVLVEVGEDHLAGYKRSPKIAIAELIWNSLDADATEVKVEVVNNEWDGPEQVLITDNGSGMTPVDAVSAFRNFGNSWKLHAQGTAGDRTLHGRHGRGRYTAFSIGVSPVWTTIGEDDGVRTEFTVTGSDSHLRNFEISGPLPTEDPTGTVLTINNLTDAAERELMREGMWGDLTTRFAPYLEQYPLVKIFFRGNVLNPESLRERTDISTVQVEGTEITAQLHIIEWSIKVERKLFLCDENGSALLDIKPGVQVPGYNFTAYLRWPGFAEIGHDILTAELDSGPVGDLVTAAKDRIRDYFKERANDRQKEVIKEWEDNGVYPYAGLAQSATQVAERQAFDIVALSAASIVNEGSTRSRKLTLSLIKAALEAGPTALQDVLRNVLELPEDRVNELKNLLDRTTLSSIIEVSKKIADRLDFIQGLDALIFDKETKKQTLERRQLHRILANETWMFGEEWALTGDDDRLTQVLIKYLHFLGRGDEIELANMPPALSVEGGVIIPDLVLSRTHHIRE